MKGLLEHFEMDGGVASHGPVHGKPYEAEIEEIHTRYKPPQSAKAYGKQWRDSSGSVRTDAVTPDPTNPAKTIKFTSIFDATKNAVYFGSPDIGLGHTLALPHSAEELQAILASQCQPSFPPPGPAVVPAEQTPQVELLGEKVIQGVTCTGVRSIDAPSGLLTEHWFSKDLVLGLLNIRKDSDGEIVFRVVNLRLIEPDPSLFFLPQEG